MCLEPFLYFSIPTKRMSMFCQLFCDTMPILSKCALGVCKSVGYKSIIALESQSLSNLPPSKLGLYYKSPCSRSPKLSSSVLYEGFDPQLSIRSTIVQLYQTTTMVCRSWSCICARFFQGHQGLHIHEKPRHRQPLAGRIDAL